MKFSETELRKLFDGKLQVTTEELCHQLTMLGLEVEECEPVAPAFSGVKVGEILEAIQHPNADRLRVCQVNVGSDTALNIVCGAPNARTGIKVAVSTVGACLPGDFKIKETQLRGVASQGMLCSEKELGLPESIDGIIELDPNAPIGMDIREYLNLDDHVITINLTPNRGDCLSLYGIAREVAVLNQLPVPQLKIKPVDSMTNQTVSVNVAAHKACPRYLLAVVEGVNNNVVTPVAIKQRLERSGIRSISPVVDILNDVMIFTGQPMHAFDAAKVQGIVTVEFAKEGESVSLLNDETIKLRRDTLTIRDDKGAIAVAGIMGNKPSSVAESTTKILVEAAFFDPLVLAGKARSYGLHTDSSHRFERGVDPNLSAKALALALQKIEAITGGACVGLIEKVSEKDLPKPAVIKLHNDKMTRLLGVEIDPEFSVQSLQSLGCEILKAGPEQLEVKVPSWRFDLTIEEDLIEELVRLQGYDSLPLELPKFSLVENFSREAETCIAAVKTALVANGLAEVVTYSFIDEDLQKIFFNEAQYKLSNPITKELTSMRKSLIPSLLSTLQYNLNRQQEALAIFEVGERFVGEKAVIQIETLAGLLYGNKTDFYGLKGLVEKVLKFCRITAKFAVNDVPSYMHPGQTQTIWLEGRSVGYFGAVHPKLLHTFDLKHSAFVFKLDTAVFKQGAARVAKPISKFPTIERDLAFLVARSLPAETLLDAVSSVKSAILQDVSVFDVYAGDRLPADQKSIAIKLKMQDLERTLVDEEVDQLINKIIQSVTTTCKAILREG